MTGRKRLHISPLNAQLLPTVLPPSLLLQASNISYHTIQTFPEKDYGYVDLPELEADKLKKKLNGSVLKGSKMRVELARHEKDTTEGRNGLPVNSELTLSNASRRGKTKTREEGVIPGYELPTERKVKRGWTEPTSSDAKPTKLRKDRVVKKSRPKTTSLTGQAECLFKTTLPPNASGADAAKEGKAKKRKRGDSNRDVVVHEYSNTTKHASFLRDELGAEGKKIASEYIEGKGWVDEDGSTVEAEPEKRRSKVKIEEANEELTVSKPRRSRRSSKLEVPLVEVTAPKIQGVKGEPVDDETSSSGTSSDSESDSEVERSENPPPARKSTRASARKPKAKSKGLGISEAGDGEVEVDRVERLSITRSSATPPPVQEPQSISAPATDEVHPLEALFKRPNNAASHTPKKPNLEVSTSFNFFDPDVDEGESQTLLIPQTPFTQQDIRQRRQRSAAPTPDTAAPGKTFGDIWVGTSDVSEVDGDDEEEDTAAGKTEGVSTGSKDEKPETEFSKWFWEHRGETNRAWKRRRREAAKEKRQKDNKERRG
ncbi:hypothetical protein HO173_010695 [Letharia columbiana]|uniref:Uncharacterized protein n=1 Tax=Letharia columbiana TaxID=112416 RepID=A0A8H6FLZ5_9LECA|nr:uncharacterized protein HO173_010695 [Letharia columbiana]KAF6230995.1 hypothetical protein HO173_010695 [Letharia columbiana]